MAMWSSKKITSNIRNERQKVSYEVQKALFKLSNESSDIREFKKSILKLFFYGWGLHSREKSLLLPTQQPPGLNPGSAVIFLSENFSLYFLIFEQYWNQTHLSNGFHKCSQRWHPEKNVTYKKISSYFYSTSKNRHHFMNNTGIKNSHLTNVYLE